MSPTAEINGRKTQRRGSTPQVVASELCLAPGGWRGTTLNPWAKGRCRESKVDRWDTITHTIPRTGRTGLEGGGEDTAASEESGISAEGTQSKDQADWTKI